MNLCYYIVSLFSIILHLIIFMVIECASNNQTKLLQINNNEHNNFRLIVNNFLLKQFKNVSMCKYYKCNYSIKLNETIFKKNIQINESTILSSNGNKILIHNSIYFIRLNFNLFIYLNNTLNLSFIF